MYAFQIFVDYFVVMQTSCNLVRAESGSPVHCTHQFQAIDPGSDNHNFANPFDGVSLVHTKRSRHERLIAAFHPREPPNVQGTSCREQFHAEFAKCEGSNIGSRKYPMCHTYFLTLVNIVFIALSQLGGYR